MLASYQHIIILFQLQNTDPVISSYLFSIKRSWDDVLGNSPSGTSGFTFAPTSDSVSSWGKSSKKQQQTWAAVTESCFEKRCTDFTIRTHVSLLRIKMSLALLMQLIST